MDEILLRRRRWPTGRAFVIALCVATLLHVPVFASRLLVFLGVVNELAFFLNAGSIVARRKGRRGLGKALSGGALGLALAGGFLGGQLVYGHGIGVGHTLTKPQG